MCHLVRILIYNRAKNVQLGLLFVAKWEKGEAVHEKDRLETPGRS